MYYKIAAFLLTATLLPSCSTDQDFTQISRVSSHQSENIMVEGEVDPTVQTKNSFV